MSAKIWRDVDQRELTVHVAVRQGLVQLLGAATQRALVTYIQLHSNATQRALVTYIHLGLHIATKGIQFFTHEGL